MKVKMKWTILITCLALIVSTTTIFAKDSDHGQSMKETISEKKYDKKGKKLDMPEVFKVYYEGWESLNPEKIASAFAEDGVLIDDANPNGVPQHEIAAYLTNQFEMLKTLGIDGFYALQMEPAGEDRFIGIWSTNTDADVVFHGTSFYKIADGKIKSSKIITFFD